MHGSAIGLCRARKSLIECHSFCSSPCKPPYYKKVTPLVCWFLCICHWWRFAILDWFPFPMREVQNSPVFFTSRWLFGLGGRFPVREVQNFAGICTSRIRHERHSVFSPLIRDINKQCDWPMSRKKVPHRVPHFLFKPLQTTILQKEWPR